MNFPPSPTFLMYGSGYVGLSLTNMGKHYGISDIILLGLTPPFPTQK